MERAMYFAKVAEDFYAKACPNHAQNGYEKNVLIDTKTEECIFVSSEIQPVEGELVFRCRRAKGITVTTLKTPKKEKERRREKLFNYPQIKGNVYTGKDEYGCINTLVDTPFEMPEASVLTTKLSNMNEFMDIAMRKGMFLRQPFEALRELEMRVQEAYPGCLNETIKFTYRMNNEKGYDYIFKFSHFEKISPRQYCAVYDFIGETCESKFIPINVCTYDTTH